MTAEVEYGGFVVDLEEFSGPLDLLLSLIRREQVDIFDIPIARITDQYLAALDTMRDRQVEVSAEFMVMAATLMQVKSKLLLPRPPAPVGEEEEEEDPRRELVQLLLEYQRYREAADLLDGLSQQRERLFGTPGEQPDFGPPTVDEATLTALFRAYERLVVPTPEPEAPKLRHVRYTVREQQEVILARLVGGPVPFTALFSGQPTRVEAVATFMALLELIRNGEVAAEQPGIFEEIVIRRVEPGVRTPTEPA